MRKVLFWMHLTAGTVAGTVVFVMAATGVVLAFQAQVLRFVERGPRAVEPPSPGARPLGPEALLASAGRAGAQPTSLTFDADPHVAVAVAVGRDGVLYLDPYTGAVRGTGAARARAFFRAVQDWHRFLGVEGEGRATARAVTGACNAAFLFLSLSGLVLWWPKQWTRRHLRAVALFQGGLRGRARDFNWHNVIGVWCMPVLFFLTLTALTLSYPAVGNLLYAPGGGPAGAPRRDDAPRFDGLDRAWARAQATAPGWTLVTLRPPTRADAPVAFTITHGASRGPFGRSSLTVDARTGEVVKWEPFAGFAAGRKLRAVARFGHTGEILSWPGQLLAALASLGGACLVVTGLSLAWRRFRAWRPMMERERSHEAPEPDPSQS